MGGFSSYAFQIYLRMDHALMGPGVLDRLQEALRAGAPGWSKGLRVSGVGVWPVRGPVDVNEPGSLEAVLRSHLPGGAKFPRTIGEAQLFRGQVRLGGTDRGVTFELGIEASVRGAAPNRQADFVFVETTKPAIDGIAAPEWIESLFRALCRELRPAFATASSMGERGAQGRVYGFVDPHIKWLTWFGAADAARVDATRLGQVDGLEVDRSADGLLLKLGSAPTARAYRRYLRLLKATETAIGYSRIVAAFGRRESVYGSFPSPEPEPAAPMPIKQAVRKPEVIVDEAGVEHVRGGRYEGIRLQSVDYRRPGAVIEGIEAVRCEFDHCGLGPFESREAPLIVRNCRLDHCRISQADLRFVQFEDCVVDGLRGSMTITTSGPLLRHVTIRGNVDSLYLRPPGFGIRPDLRAIERYNAFYETVDWALDISEAKLARCEMPGVPGHLVRRDPKTQILITRDRVLATPWQEVAAGTLEYFGIEGFLRCGGDSYVEVACPRAKDFEERLASFARLREAGIAEPD